MKKAGILILALTMTLALALGGSNAAMAGGHHHHHGHGAAAFGLGLVTGIIALGALSDAEAAARARETGCEIGPRECRWVPRRCYYDADLGDDVCRGGYRKCWRREYCD